MSNDLTIEGVGYISSKRASEITGYSQDYVGQLARAGKIVGKRVGGLWYILAESLSGYKEVAESYIPVPPAVKAPRSTEDSSMVTFEGKTYVSAARAAKLTSYHQDYIGQLARGGKILSRQVGRRWYVDIDALKSHKNDKDALLGAVQASAVGIQKSDGYSQDAHVSTSSDDPYNVGLHYKYIANESPLIPVIIEAAKNTEPINSAVSEKHSIPIRIVRPSIVPEQATPIIDQPGRRHESRMPVLSIFMKTFPIIAIAALVILVYNFSLSSASILTLKTPFGYKQPYFPGIPHTEAVKRLAGSFFTKEIRYTRD